MPHWSTLVMTVYAILLVGLLLTGAGATWELFGTAPWEVTPLGCALEKEALA